MSCTYFQILIVCGLVIMFNNFVLFYFANVCFASSQQGHEADSVCVSICVYISMFTLTYILYTFIYVYVSNMYIYIYLHIKLVIIINADINYIFPLWSCVIFYPKLPNQTTL